MLNDRRSVLIVLYDLPVMTPVQRRDARLFRKYLISVGYLSLQKSVYVKLLHNDSFADAEIQNVKKKVPKDGTVNMLNVSLNVFLGLRNLAGEAFDKAMFADDIIVA